MSEIVERAKAGAKDRRILARYECGWCGQRLDRDSCGAIYDRCSAEMRQQRNAACLAEHKARKALGEG